MKKITFFLFAFLATLLFTPKIEAQGPIFLPVITKELPPGIYLQKNSTNHFDFDGHLYVMGEVFNHTPQSAKWQSLYLRLYDGNELLETSFFGIHPGDLPSEEVGCYKFRIPEPLVWTHYEMSGTYTASNTTLPKFQITDDQGLLKSNGVYIVSGTVRNLQSEEIVTARVFATLFNAEGKVLDCEYGYASTTTLGSGQSSTFVVAFKNRENYSSVTRYKMLATGIIPN